MIGQGMTEEGLHQEGAASQFWCVILAKIVRGLSAALLGPKYENRDKYVSGQRDKLIKMSHRKLDQRSVLV